MPHIRDLLSAILADPYGTLGARALSPYKGFSMGYGFCCAIENIPFQTGHAFDEQFNMWMSERLGLSRSQDYFSMLRLTTRDESEAFDEFMRLASIFMPDFKESSIQPFKLLPNEQTPSALIDNIRMRPWQYGVGYTVESISAFVDGYSYALLTERKQMLLNPDFRDFTHWLHDHFHFDTVRFKWDKLIQFNCITEAEAVVKFNELYDKWAATKL
jgi:hypothetical protein